MIGCHVMDAGLGVGHNDLRHNVKIEKGGVKT